MHILDHGLENLEANIVAAQRLLRQLNKTKKVHYAIVVVLLSASVPRGIALCQIRSKKMKSLAQISKWVGKAKSPREFGLGKFLDVRHFRDLHRPAILACG